MIDYARRGLEESASGRGFDSRRLQFHLVFGIARPPHGLCGQASIRSGRIKGDAVLVEREGECNFPHYAK